MHAGIGEIENRAIVCDQANANGGTVCRCKPAQLHNRAILAKDLRRAAVYSAGLYIGEKYYSKVLARAGWHAYRDAAGIRPLNSCYRTRAHDA